MRNMLLYFGAVAIMMIVVVFIVPADPEPVKPSHEHYYPEVVYMLNNDSIMDIMRFWGIPTVTCHDWENTASALDIPLACMTIDIYMDHLQHDSYTKYKRNRAVK